MWTHKPPMGTPLKPGYHQLERLAAWWLLQEGSGDKIYDLSGAGNTGRLNGFAFPSTVTSGWNPGRSGRTLAYDGLNDYVNIGLVLGDLFTTTKGTWTAWVRPTDATPAGLERIICFGDTGGNEMLQLTLLVDGKLQAFCRDAAVDQFILATDNSVFSDNKWTHVALVQDGVAAVLYVDGIRPAQTYSVDTDTASWFFELAGLDNGRIGDRNFWGAGEGNWFEGSIDDVRIYKRALAQSEIQDIIANPFAAFAAPPVAKYFLSSFTQEEVDPMIALSKSRIRHPTFSVFIAGHGDITSDGMSAEYKRRAEDSLHEPNYGTGTLTINDDKQIYIENGRSVFRLGDQVMLFAGFDNRNIPRFSGLIRDIQVQANSKVQTLTISDQGYRLRKSKTSGDFSSYNTPKKLVDYLANLARIGAVVYEDETGPPTTFTFGNTFLSLRSFWAMIHGAALCISYIQFFDAEGKLNLARRTTFEETGYVFTDSEIHRLRHVQVAELINHKTIDYVKCIRPEFTAGDGIHPGQHTKSRTDSMSKRKYGEYEDQETDELIGSWTNAGKMIEQILDHYPIPRHIYQMDTPAYPQLNIADRIFVSSDETGIEGFFYMIGIDERFNTAGYPGKYTLLSAGELF